MIFSFRRRRFYAITPLPLRCRRHARYAIFADAIISLS